ncbi:hypothetical protein OG864_01730 [Streptomyces sp. NBC_00124]|uniref:hypothetical protein n=1 Tax=Streptomyces sp. NBC_00124 TaxID=2975662 RepID=UPI00225B21E7|nr:hypothetical protein [Streptomyces sp. NBC_00124]MCX5357481.1 hypothetical protein [Streptomyces sp. NBC_00124]
MAEYQELPYLIRHRADTGAETRADLIQWQADIFARLTRHQAVLDLESPLVGQAYRTLFERTHPECRRYRMTAWTAPPLEGDEQVPNLGGDYPYDNVPELQHCLSAMRRELSLWSFLTNRLTRQEHYALRCQRALA